MMLTMVCCIIFNIQSVTETMSESMEYGSSTQLVYSISKRDESLYDGDMYPTITSGGTVEIEDVDIEDEVTDRLDAVGVRDADVEIVNGDSDGNGWQLRVTFSPISSTELENVKMILGFNNNLSVCTVGDDYCMTADKGQFFDTDTDDVAELEYNGTTPYPTINLLSDSDFQQMKEYAEIAAEAHSNDTPAEDSSSSETTVTTSPKMAEGDEEEEEDAGNDESTKLYLWMNKTSEDTYDKAYGTNDTTVVQEVLDKVVAVLDVNNYDEDDCQIAITSDLDGSAFSISGARALVEALNADDYGFDIAYLYSNTVYATFGTTALTTTYIIMGVALLIVALLMILFFGLSGITGTLTMLVSVFVSLWLVTLMGFEFSIGTLIGLIVVAMQSLYISVNYFTHVKKELRKDRGMDKANREGYHKSFFYSLDASAIIFIGSILGFLCTTGHFTTIFGVMMIGSLFTFIITNYLDKWATYWLTKDGQTKMPVFGFNRKRNDKAEKENKDAKYVSSDSQHHSNKVWKGVGIATIALVAISLPLAAVFGADGYSIFNGSGQFESSYTLNVTFQTSSQYYSPLDTSEDFLLYIENIGTYDDGSGNSYIAYSSEDEDIPDTLEDNAFIYYPDTCYVNQVEKSDEDGNTYYINYYTVDVSVDLNGIVLQNGLTVVEQITNVVSDEYVNVDGTYVYPGRYSLYIDDTLEIGSYLVSSGNYATSASYLIMLIFIIACMTAFYSFLRYGILVGLTELGGGGLYCALAVGLLAATRLPFNYYSGFGVILGLFAVSIAAIQLFGGNKYTLKEQGIRRDATPQQRELICNETINKQLNPTIIWLIFGLVFTIALYFVNSAMFSVATISLVSLALVLPLCLYVVAPFYYWLSTNISFARFHAWREKRREARGIQKAQADKNGIVYVDQDSPHETIIVGINEFLF